MIPIYIFGLLQRYGPQHGYIIKKNISSQLADFTQIKLPSIYYHLEKLAKSGYLTADREIKVHKAEKTIYAINEKGKKEFQRLLRELLNFNYRPTFASDGIFFFSDYLDICQITLSLEAYINGLIKTISFIQNHKRETLNLVPEEMKTMVNIIFSHHEHHYRAELEWAKETLKGLSA